MQEISYEIFNYTQITSQNKQRMEATLLIEYVEFQMIKRACIVERSNIRLYKNV